MAPPSQPGLGEEVFTADIRNGKGHVGAWRCQRFFKASLRQPVMREATGTSPSTEQKNWYHPAWVEVRESVGIRCHTDLCSFTGKLRQVWQRALKTPVTGLHSDP